MAEAPPDLKPLDPGRIETVDAVERDYWSRTLGCSPAQLDEAIAAVGNHLAAVREYLASRR